MTTLTPREPYSQEELEQLYPKDLKLQLVQVVGCAELLYTVQSMVEPFADTRWTVPSSWCEFQHGRG